jgi:hypothetical protein
MGASAAAPVLESTDSGEPLMARVFRDTESVDPRADRASGNDRFDTAENKE